MPVIKKKIWLGKIITVILSGVVRFKPIANNISMSFVAGIISIRDKVGSIAITPVYTHTPGWQWESLESVQWESESNVDLE